MSDPAVLVAWATGTTGAGLAGLVAADLLGTHPGPLHHHCPRCGSIEHGRPSFDAPVAVSIAYAGATVLVAVGMVEALGVDLEASGALLEPEGATWVEEEAVAKARGTGLTDLPQDRAGLRVTSIDVPGHVAALAIGSGRPAVVRLVPGGPAAPDGRARP